MSNRCNGTIVLIQSSDDPPLLSAEYQEGLQKVRASLRSQGIEADAPFIVMDSPMGGGGYIGDIVGAWLQGMSGRKVRVKVGDTEVEATTKEEFEQLLHRLTALPPLTLAATQST